MSHHFDGLFEPDETSDGDISDGDISDGDTVRDLYSEWEESHCHLCQSQSPGTMLCSRCKSGRYCSKGCQTADWPMHRVLCKAWAQQPARPDQYHQRAILFPEQCKDPKLVWVDSQGGEKVAEILGKTNTTDRTQFNVNARAFKLLTDRRLYLWFRDFYMVDGSVPNRSVYGCLAPLGMPGHDWRGPLLLCREDEGNERARDIEMSDFRHALGFFLTYGRGGGRTECCPEPGDLVGVRINCAGEHRIGGAAKFAPALVASDSAYVASSRAHVSPISCLLGLGLRVAKIGNAHEWNRSCPDGLLGQSNPEAAFLMMGADPSSSNWGWAPMHWQNQIGSVIVTRVDNRDLHVEHAAALLYFVCRVLQPMFEHSNEGGDDSSRKDKVLQATTPERFQRSRVEDRDARVARYGI